MLPIEKQVCSLEYAKKLKELGVKQESYFYFDRRYAYGHPSEKDHYVITTNPSMEKYAAFTVAELGVMLPPEFGTMTPLSSDEWECHTIRNKVYHGVEYINKGDIKRWDSIVREKHVYTLVETEANCRARMLIDAISNKITTVSEINDKFI